MEITDQAVLDIILKAGAILDEVVVVGYGKEKKVNLTGSVASISNEELTRVPVANSSNLLSGRAPGVITRQNSGLPGGEDTQIRIRGFANSPLILVDGVQTDFSRVDPNDIESVNVLKDASAAVYGARAGNGVILITTKRGKEGKPRISYNGTYSVQEAISFMQHVNPAQYVELWRESNLLDGNDPNARFTEQDLTNFQNKAPGYEGGDWVDALIDNYAPMQQHSLSVNGGTEEIKYYTSFGTTTQESYFRTRDYDYKRYNARSNLDAKINNNLSFNLDLSYRQDRIERPQSNTSDVWVELNTAQPVFPTSLPDPEVGVPFSGFSQRNPVAATDKDIYGTYNQIDNTFRGKLGLEYKMPFLEGLVAKAEVNTIVLDRSSKTFRKPYELYQYLPETDTYQLEGVGNTRSFVGESQFRRTQMYPLVSLEYSVTTGNHTIKALGLAEKITRQFSSFSAQRFDLLSVNIPEIFIGSTDQATNNGSSGADIGRTSYVGRLNYRYKDRYLLEATFRADGNVLFAPETRWGYFPSISAGWVLSEESFLNSVDGLELLKIRISYSRLGDDSANGLSGFDYLTGYGLTNGYLLGNSEYQPSIQTLGLVNPFLTWEEITMYNFGIEAELWKGKLGIEADVFYRKREGLLGPNIADIPSTFGASLPLVNLDSRDNRGFELALNYKDNIGPFSINLAPNFTFARAKWIDVKSQEDFEDPDQRRINELDGQWVNRNFGYLSDGIFMSQSEIEAHNVIQDGNDNSTLRPGDIRYIDRDGDGVLTFRDQDIIGYAQGLPELMYGVDIGISYGNFRLNTLFQGASRFAINISGAARAMFSNTSTPLSYQYDYRWQPDPNNPGVNINPNAQLPAATQAPGSNNGLLSDFWWKNASYLRIKNLNLSYKLPKNIIRGVQNAQVYVASENLTTWTNLGIYADSFDPEFQPGQPSRTYPITRTFTLGLNVTF